MLRNLVVHHIQSHYPDSGGISARQGIRPLAVDASDRLSPANPEVVLHERSDFSAEPQGIVVTGARELPVTLQQRPMQQPLNLDRGTRRPGYLPAAYQVPKILPSESVLIEKPLQVVLRPNRDELACSHQMMLARRSAAHPIMETRQPRRRIRHARPARSLWSRPEERRISAPGAGDSGQVGWLFGLSVMGMASPTSRRSSTPTSWAKSETRARGTSSRRGRRSTEPVPASEGGNGSGPLPLSALRCALSARSADRTT